MVVIIAFLFSRDLNRVFLEHGQERNNPSEISFKKQIIVLLSKQGLANIPRHFRKYDIYQMNNTSLRLSVPQHNYLVRNSPLMPG